MRLYGLVVLCTMMSIYNISGQNSDFLKFKDRFIELGEIEKGKTASTTFYFENVSSETIEIDIIDACECTELGWTRGKIEPGASGSIDVIFDSSEKDKSETIDIDITLVNTDPNTGGPVMDNVKYSFVLKK